MPRLASSPWPHEVGDPLRPRTSGFPGARHGRIRWQASLGPRRDESFAWCYQRPSRPLVRADGVALVDWNGILRAFSPTGRRLWERDLVADPKASWAYLWGGLLLVDDHDRTWVRTQKDLQVLALDGRTERTLAGFGSPVAALPFPAGGFIRCDGTDEGYWTGHWPCTESAIDVLDDDGKVVASHAVGGAPGAAIRLLDERRALVLLRHEAQPSPHPREELVVCADGTVESRRPLEPVGLPAALVGRLHVERNLVRAADGRELRLPGEPAWGSRQRTELHDALETADGWLVAREVAWGAGTRLRLVDPAGRERGEVRGVGWDGPLADAEGWVYACIADGGALRLVGVRDGVERFRCTLLAAVDFAAYAYPHGGFPAEMWRTTGWFHAPAILGPGGTVLVVTDVGRVDCVLFCVE